MKQNLIGLLIGLMLGLVAAVPAELNTAIVVDGTTCTLADALTAANNDTATGGCPAGSGADVLELTNQVDLTAALPSITSTITIEGNGHTIARTGGPDFRLLTIANTGHLTLNNATITGGRALGIAPAQRGGGAIYINMGGIAIITHSTLHNNLAGEGGGIANRGTLTLTHTTLRDNTSGVNSGGGGLWNNGTATLTHNTLSGNHTDGGGGGVWNNGTATLTNNTLSGNDASGGGGLYSTNTITLTNNTIWGNIGLGGGGGLWNQATATLVRNMIVGNISFESQQAEVWHQAGTINGNNYNVVGYGGNSHSTGFVVAGSDVIPTGELTTVLAATLADNGGATLTHALVTGSPAIDIAPAEDCTAAPVQGVDQRGITRPQGAGCDAGAVEAVLFSLAVDMAGAGSGQVQSAPVGPIFVQGEEVTLTATADLGSTFTGWSGDVVSTANPITVTMDSAKAITATFALNPTPSYAIYLPLVVR